MSNPLQVHPPLATSTEADAAPPSSGLWAACIGLLATLATGLACVGPLVAIVLGIGGFGWLTRYAHLQLPATGLTVLLLGFGFRRVYGRRFQPCRHTNRARLSRALLWLATLLAAAIHVTEYLVLPNL